ncbi:MAG TPA: DNA polymerase III subunit delta' [Candidatus Limiplasma sp.]|nr:DNA polymerase III subunit delta' [Candidatus Limiplasma sp.]HPS82358.1 DNA polymerase III subunit delta' [Candidatus Limiplasma sp.]
MPRDENSAGLLPAFVDYAKLGTGYRLLTEQVAARQTVHAYLLAGPRGVGKATFARYLAATLYCESETAKPCGVCAACQRVFTHNEPDLLEVFSTEDKAISIDRVREMISTISQHSFGNGPRLVLIEPMEKLTPSAQNCLLKSLEEPPADVLFFLLSHEPSALLGTIASRCSLIKLTPWPDPVLFDTLTRLGYTPKQAEAVLPRAGGNIGEAITLLRNEGEAGEMQSLVRQALSAVSDVNVVTLSGSVKDNRESAERMLAALEQALHQALLVRTGVLPQSAIEDPQILAWAEHATSTALTELIQAVFETRKRRQSQVNWQACFDRLLMKIVEAKSAWQQS